MYLEHQTFGQWDDCPIDPATSRILLKVVGFFITLCIHCNGVKKGLTWWCFSERWSAKIRLPLPYKYIHTPTPWTQQKNCHLSQIWKNRTIPDSCCQRQRSNHSHDLAQYEFSLFLIRSSTLWHFRLWSFQGKDTKLERFLAKNQLYSNEITKFWELE